MKGEKRKSFFSDPRCHLDPCLSNPCLSNGTCHSFLSTRNYSCFCPDQYTGEHCESDLIITFARDMNDKNTSELWPLAIVFGYIFSLMLVFIIIWFLW
jgi:hypothetical protein